MTDERRSMCIDRTLWPETCHGRWMNPEYEPGLVSVIIPTYNRAHLLVETMDSVWNQTYRPIELIVVDDGSTDNTQAVLHDWAQKCEADDQFRLRTFHQDNKGAPTARNKGAIESRGQYIQFWDSEDLMVPHKLQMQINAAVTQEADIVVCDVQFFAQYPGDLSWIFHYGSPAGLACDTEDIVTRYIESYAWSTLAVLLSRSAAVKAGPWREDLRRSQDVEFNCRAAMASRRLVGIGEVMSFARKNEDRSAISNDTSAVALSGMVAAIGCVERTMSASRHLNARTRAVLSKRLTYLAGRALEWGHRAEAERACSEAIRLATPGRRVLLRGYLTMLRVLGAGITLGADRAGRRLARTVRRIRNQRSVL